MADRGGEHLPVLCSCTVDMSAVSLLSPPCPLCFVCVLTLVFPLSFANPPPLSLVSVLVNLETKVESKRLEAASVSSFSTKIKVQGTTVSRPLQQRQHRSPVAK